MPPTTMTDKDVVYVVNNYAYFTNRIRHDYALITEEDLDALIGGLTWNQVNTWTRANRLKVEEARAELHELVGFTRYG